MRKSGKVVECTTCGTPIYKALWELKKSKSNKHFCSRVCSNTDPEKLSEEVKCRFSKLFSGKKLSGVIVAKLRAAALGKPKPWIQGCRHPRWAGGKFGYPHQFNKALKLQIKARDAYMCVLCDETEAQAQAKDGLGRGLTIHHLDHNRDNNNNLNLCTLCRSCNSKEMTNPAAYKDKLRSIVNDIVRTLQKCEDFAGNEQGLCAGRE